MNYVLIIRDLLIKSCIICSLQLIATWHPSHFSPIPNPKEQNKFEPKGRKRNYELRKRLFRGNNREKARYFKIKKLGKRAKKAEQMSGHNPESAQL